MKIIFLSDVVGKIGRRAVAKELPSLKKKYQPDLVIANGENLSHGIGFTEDTLNEMIRTGVDFFTSGNHVWARKNSLEILDRQPPAIIRPANCPRSWPGVGFREIILGRERLLVVNLLGRVFIPGRLNCPFKTSEEILKQYPQIPVLVDFHAEATSEKNAFGQYFDGRVSAVIGTHTHVPTCDQKILTQGTGYLTDAGMIGYYDSVIGAEKSQVFNLFLEGGRGSKKHDLPEWGECQFNAVYLEIDSKKMITRKIERIDKIIKI